MPPSRKLFYERAKSYYAPTPRKRVVAKRTRATPAAVPSYTRTRGEKEEVKFFDTPHTFSVDATGEVPATGQLNLIPQGDTESTRDGRQCTIKSIQIRGEMNFAPGAGAVGGTHVYMWLVLDKQCNGAAAAITDVFTSSSCIQNLVNLANSGRFRIIKKWVMPYNVGAGVTTAYVNVVKQIEFFKKCNIPLQFSSTTGAITEIKSNNLFLLAGSSSDDLVAFQGQTRLRFVG